MNLITLAHYPSLKKWPYPHWKVPAPGGILGPGEEQQQPNTFTLAWTLFGYPFLDSCTQKYRDRGWKSGEARDWRVVNPWWRPPVPCIITRVHLREVPACWPLSTPFHVRLACLIVCVHSRTHIRSILSLPSQGLLEGSMPQWVLYSYQQNSDTLSPSHAAKCIQSSCLSQVHLSSRVLMMANNPLPLAPPML